MALHKISRGLLISASIGIIGGILLVITLMAIVGFCLN